MQQTILVDTCIVSDASVDGRKFYFRCVDDATGQNSMAGLTFSAAEIQVSKNGAAEGNSAGSVTGIGLGSYIYQATTAEVNVKGITRFRINKTGVERFEILVRVVDDIQAAILAKLPAALVGGRMDSSVGSYASGLAPLQPTTAGRTLDVTATGGAGIDWANVENQATVVNLSQTTIPGAGGGGTVTVEGFTLASGTCQSGSTSNTIKLSAGDSAFANEQYTGAYIYIVAGTGVGQWAVITGFNNSTKVCTVRVYSNTKLWTVVPDSTSQYNIIPVKS